MLGCLALHHPTITSLTKCRMLRSLFHAEDFEIEVISRGVVMIYIWNARKIDIWQAAVLFESAAVRTGYAFGINNKEAIKQRVLDHLDVVESNDVLREQLFRYDVRKMNDVNGFEDHTKEPLEKYYAAHA
ncbi:hypothetical protein [Lentibacillus saliphilus]|uniref:hypothetical protein n=1 Tax=Lentibacillus saliphilus TaxID=2737028 RepID=UPI001C2FC6B0|nr:hypothetical protein [Lentibacillus saliphilus]